MLRQHVHIQEILLEFIPRYQVLATTDYKSKRGTPPDVIYQTWVMVIINIHQ